MHVDEGKGKYSLLAMKSGLILPLFGTWNLFGLHPHLAWFHLLSTRAKTI